MFDNHSYMWILALLFVVLNCNGLLDSKCDCAGGAYNKSNTGSSFMILIVIAFFFLLNGNDIF